MRFLELRASLNCCISLQAESYRILHLMFNVLDRMIYKLIQTVCDLAV